MRQRRWSTSNPAVVQNAGRMAGTNAGGRGAGTSAARFRSLPLAQLHRIWWGSNAAQEPREPDGCSIGRQVIHLTPRRNGPWCNTPGLKPAMRCWEILTVAPQRRCRYADMRLESCPPHDRSSQIRWPREFCVWQASVKTSRHISASSILVAPKMIKAVLVKSRLNCGLPLS